MHNPDTRVHNLSLDKTEIPSSTRKRFLDPRHFSALVWRVAMVCSASHAVGLAPKSFTTKVCNSGRDASSGRSARRCAIRSTWTEEDDSRGRHRPSRLILNLDSQPRCGRPLELGLRYALRGKNNANFYVHKLDGNPSHHVCLGVGGGVPNTILARCASGRGHATVRHCHPHPRTL